MLRPLRLQYDEDGQLTTRDPDHAPALTDAEIAKSGHASYRAEEARRARKC